MPRASAPRTTAAPSGCSLACSRLAARARSSASVQAAQRRRRSRAPAGPRSTSRSCRPRSVSTFSRTSSAAASRMRTPALAPRPTPTMIDIGVASPSAHGQAMMSTATALTSAWASRGSGPNDRPDDEGHDRDQRPPPGRTSPTRGRRGAGSARATAAPRRPGGRSARARVSAPTFSARMTKPPVRVDGPPDHPIAGCLVDRDRLAGDHRLVDRAGPGEDHAVDRDLLAGTDAERVAGVDRGEVDVALAAVGADPPRRLRRQPEERA